MKHTTRSRRVLALLSATVLALGSAACATTPYGGMAGASASTSDIAADHFGMAVNLGEVEEGQLAQSRAASAPVRQFATQMVTEHTAALERQQQLMTAMGMQVEGRTEMMSMLQSHPVSQPVVQNHMQAMQALQGATGAAFDRAYMQRQVELHRFALEEMDRMLPTLTDPARRALMTQMRASVAMHLQMAQQIQAAL